MGKYVLLLISFLIADYSFGQNADLNLLKKININHPCKLDGTFRLISNTTRTLSIATPLAVIITGIAEDEPDVTRKGFVIGASFLTAMTLETCLKHLVRRQRPFNASEDIDQKIHSHGFSFPSGHCTEAFAIATSLSLTWPKWYVITPAFLWAGTVAYSRMFLGVHYPSDVLAGILIGVGSSFLCYSAQRWIK